MELNFQEINDGNIIHNFQKLCGFEPRYYPFPGGLPVSMTNKSFSMFNNFKYRVCDKSNGTRYMMYLTTCDNGKNRIGYLINRSMKIYKINIDLGVVPHIGSVLDGELIKKTDGSWSYLIFDIFATKGTPMININSHEKRLKTFSSNKLMKNVTEPFTMHIKKFYNMNEFDQLINDNNKLNYETDGLIFTPENRKIYNGTDKGTFKWKPTSENTIDFQIKKKDNSYVILLWDNRSRIEINDVHIHNIPLKEKLDKTLKEKETVIIECQWENEYSKWLPIKIREDKSHPNSVKTYMATLETIQDDITLDKLKLLLNK